MNAAGGIDLRTRAIFGGNDSSSPAELAGSVDSALRSPGLLSQLGPNVGIDPNTVIVQGEGLVSETFSLYNAASGKFEPLPLDATVAQGLNLNF